MEHSYLVPSESGRQSKIQTLSLLLDILEVVEGDLIICPVGGETVSDLLHQTPRGQVEVVGGIAAVNGRSQL